MQERVPDGLMRIGEFAESSDVSARTLRYYDRIGLFTPVYIDPSTSYRYYAADQLPEIARIMALKDLGLSLEQIDCLLIDDVPAAELRGMLRLKRFEIQDHLAEESARLDRVEQRLRQIEIARLKARGEGIEPMAPCPHCGRRIHESEGAFCPYCGKPLVPPHAGLLPGGKLPRQLTTRCLILLLVVMALVAVVAGLVTILTGTRDAPELVARPLSVSPLADPQLALLSTQYERVMEKGTILFEGRVKSLSADALVDVIAIVSLYDEDPSLISAGRGSIDCNTLSPGETCGFSIEVDASPLAHHYGVVFQYASNGTIPVRDDRSR